MKFWVSFRTEALEDVESVLGYFSNYNDLAQRFNLEFERCIEQLRDFPESHQKIYFDVRRTLLLKFSIAVYYVVHLESELIEVIAVIDARRDPRLWQQRI